jgi:hypothetical protein
LRLGLPYCALPVCLFLAAVTVQAQPAWRSVYLHDEDQSSLSFSAVAFAPPGCVIATGVQVTKGRPRPVAFVSTDSGERFTAVPLKEAPRNVFALDATHAWMVTEKAVWSSTDCGMTWTRLAKNENLFRIHFLDTQRGFATGLNKTVLRTVDGGRKWEKLAVAAEPAGSPERSAYTAVAFAGSYGLISGFHEPRRPDDSPIPDWMDPSSAKRRRQWPSLTLLLQSLDAGQTWKASSSSILGKIGQVRLGLQGNGLVLIGFDRDFEVPSEVYRFDYKTGQTTRLFRDKTRAITDLAVLPGGQSILAGFAPPGSLYQLPIPGRVHILESVDGAGWREMKVDYRAVARYVSLAYGDQGPLFAATDTGMILRLDRP